MNIFVISLKESLERRTQINELLNSIGITFDFFDADNITKNPGHEIFKLYSKTKTEKYKGYQLTTAEIGCFASHISLWKKCVEINKPILILEDNIEIIGNINEQLQNISKLTNEYGLVKLGNIFDRRFIHITDIDDKHQLISNLKGACGTSGYAISPNAAKKYLNLTNGFFEPVDDFMDNEWRTKQTIFSYHPPLIRRSKITSTIGNRKLKLNKRFSTIITTELYRIYRQLRQKIYNIFK